MNMFIAQCKAELLRSLRNKKVVIFSIGFPMLFYLIFTNSAGGDAGMGGTAWKTYYLMSMTAFGLLSVSVNTLGVRMSQERAQGWVRCLHVTPLPSGAYVGAKIVSMALVNTAIIVVMFLAGGLLKGVQLSMAQWVGCGLWLLIGSLTFLALGTLVGMFKKAELAQVIASLLQIGLSLIGGLWMPVDAMPPLMKAIAVWTPSYNFGNGTWSLIAGRLPDFMNLAILAAYLIAFVILSSYLAKKQEAV
ncbi:ABC transporter permease [Paenibacillus tyrfis]|uniref:ABC transporter permease n=1 Tax=Paenibacillus tyrfis TaxID=1501230 RepID=UPI00209E33E8|nr:ABC transporter permease [Paenibacillus tyrfis]MCP1307387.1 ABC transporter permease [Paenibacillus tyrfis]